MLDCAPMEIEITTDDAADDRLDAATESGINAKHRRLRGSDRLLYTLGTTQPSCQQRCGCGAYHPCHLRTGHSSEGIGHYFTSECGGGSL